jgi:hypothetical protein
MRGALGDDVGLSEANPERGCGGHRDPTAWLGWEDECVAMRGHSTNPAAIEAEIAHLRSLALDALRRHWRVILGRTPPAALSQDLLGRMIRHRLEWEADRADQPIGFPTGCTPQRPDCLAGVGGLELRNVVANYPFESSRGFPRSEPNSGHGDHSRSSCSAGDTQLGAGF